MLPGSHSLPPSVPLSLRYAIFFYLAHILCFGWIASAQIFLGFSIIAALWGLVRGDLPIADHPLYVPLVLYCTASTISTFLRPNPWSPFPELGEWFTFMAFPLALALYRTVPVAKDLSRRTFAAVTIFLSAYGIAQYAFLGWGRGGLEQRIRATLSHVMTFSGIMLALSLFFVTLALRMWRDGGAVQSRERVVVVIAAVLSSAAIILTFTRGAWIGWASGLAVLVIRTRARWALYLATLAIVAVTFSPMPLFARLVSITDLEQASNLDRVRMIQGGVEMIRDYPLFGVGIANVKEVYPLYRAGDAPRFRIPHLHNNIVQIWAERGIFALLAYLWLVGAFVRGCLRVREREGPRRLYADAGLALAAGLTVAGLFEYNFGDSEVLHTTLGMLALTAAGQEEAPAPAVEPAPAAEANAPTAPVVA